MLNKSCLWTAAAALPALAFLAGCNKKELPKLPPPEVRVITVSEGALRPYVSTIGESIAYDEVNLVARVRGFLIKRNFVEGAMVKKGDLLFEIEPEIYQAEVQSAEALVQKTKAQFDNAEVDFKRQQTLVTQEAVSERAFDNARTTKLEAEADHNSAKAQLAIARQDLSYTKISAPFDGWVGLASVSVGNLVGPESKNLASIQRIDLMRVEFVLTEVDLLQVLKVRSTELKGDDIRIRLFTQDGKEFKGKGKIAFWNNKINSTTGTITLQAVFENPEHELLPGMFLRIRIEAADENTGLLVPLVAIMNDQAGEYVYVVEEDNTVKRHTIKTGFRNETFVFVTDNLKAGDRVISSGIQKVRPGQKAAATLDDNPALVIPKSSTKAKSAKPSAVNAVAGGSTAPAAKPAAPEAAPATPAAKPAAPAAPAPAATEPGKGAAKP